MPVACRILVAFHRCDAFHVFRCQTEQLGNLRDPKSAQQTTHNQRLAFFLAAFETYVERWQTFDIDIGQHVF